MKVIQSQSLVKKSHFLVENVQKEITLHMDDWNSVYNFRIFNLWSYDVRII